MDSTDPSCVKYNLDCVRGAIRIAAAILQHIQWKGHQEDQQLHALKIIHENISENAIPDEYMHELNDGMLYNVIRLVLLAMSNNKKEKEIQETGCSIMCTIWRFDKVSTEVRAAMDNNNADAILRHAYFEHRIQCALHFPIEKLWRLKIQP